MNNQEILNKISFWLARTTEYFDEWNWDGRELLIYLKGKVIERYSYRDVIEFLK